MKIVLKRKCRSLLLIGIIIIITLGLITSCKQYKLSYRGGLKKNAGYHASLPDPDVSFSYASPSDSNLRLLRELYNLDSVAGSGSEHERIINLMLWVHRLAPHASNPSYPKTRNALNLIDLCLNRKKAINCYMYSIILNEVYLSMGYFSRLIHLSYKHQGESHWVNAVYSFEDGKWLMMDANHGAYFMDEDGRILSIPEIRKKMINKEKIVLNKELTYVGSNTSVKMLKGILGIKTFYRWYFSKNIFKYKTNIRNVFDVESDIAAREIQLLPTHYLKKLKVPSSQSKYERYYLYRTDNEEFFWQSPLKN